MLAIFAILMFNIVMPLDLSPAAQLTHNPNDTWIMAKRIKYTVPESVKQKSIRIGDVYNRLTIISETKPIPRKDGRLVRHFLCKCSCGKFITTEGWRMRNGAVKSCGCLKKENNQGYIHGGTHTPEFQVWLSMKKRCSDENNPRNKRYAGRGIKVCERWMSFENFISDMGKRPVGRYTIERKNNDGNYEPSNCKWATYSEQMRNKSNNVLNPAIVSCIKNRSRNGESYSDIAKDLKINKVTVYSVICRTGEKQTWKDIA